MSRYKDYLIEMETDAGCLSVSEWIAKHGEYNRDVYNCIIANGGAHSSDDPVEPTL